VTDHLTDLDRSRALVREQVRQARLRTAAADELGGTIRSASATADDGEVTVAARADGTILAITLPGDAPEGLAQRLLSMIADAQRAAAYEAVRIARSAQNDSGYADVLEVQVQRRFS
jgi:hypothetical protein